MHRLGLDVHDVGSYVGQGRSRELAPGMVLTVEPGLYIFRDIEFDAPIYEDPPREDLDDALWQSICEVVVDAFEGEGKYNGTKELDEVVLGWRFLARIGLSFVVFAPDDVSRSDLDKYITALSRAYLDEVDDARFPDLEGVADLILDVEPTWYDDE